MPYVTYTISEEPLVQLRLHIKTCSVLDMARYNRMRREVNDWVLEQAGKPVDQWSAEDWQIFDDDNTAPMFGVGQDRAAMLAALERVETLNGDGTWHPGALPAEWAAMEGFAERMPPQLYYAWLGAVQKVNPVLFGVSNSDDEKKKRLRQRDLVEEAVNELLDAETDDDEAAHPLSEADMAKVDRQGLCREENLYLFETWYRLGGMQHPPSLMELADMPADLIKDLGYILGTLGRVRKERKSLRELRKK